MSSRNYCSLSAIRLIAASSLNMVAWRYLSPFFVLSERGKQSDLEIKLAMQRGHYLPKSRIRSRQSQDGMIMFMCMAACHRQISKNIKQCISQSAAASQVPNESPSELLHWSGGLRRIELRSLFTVPSTWPPSVSLRGARFLADVHAFGPQRHEQEEARRAPELGEELLLRAPDPAHHGGILGPERGAADPVQRQERSHVHPDGVDQSTGPVRRLHDQRRLQTQYPDEPRLWDA
jgi:hypothetical protein